MFDSHSDPLGIGIKSRAKQTRRMQAVPHRRGSMNVLPDPQWEGYFQALREAGVDNLADQSVGVKKGMFPSSVSALLGPEAGGPVQMGDTSMLDPLGNRDALRRRTGTGNYFETHDQFKKRYGR